MFCLMHSSFSWFCCALSKCCGNRTPSNAWSAAGVCAPNPSAPYFDWADLQLTSWNLVQGQNHHHHLPPQGWSKTPKSPKQGGTKVPKTRHMPLLILGLWPFFWIQKFTDEITTMKLKGPGIAMLHLTLCLYNQSLRK